ncbi:MAG: hypothetical protein KC912_16290 [Proteobacteria bacterium]|nr:hypothetical protein [Pseudomonadota bacterium]
MLWACAVAPTDTDRTRPGAPPGPDELPVPWVPPDVGDTRAVNDRDFTDAAVLAIDAAEVEIRVAEYLLYEGGQVDQILDALERAAERDVFVRVLADEEGDGTASVLHDLGLSGIETRLDDPTVTLHNKLILADGVALVGSHNFTNSALRYNHEGSVLVNDAAVADWYAGWFDAVWEGDPFEAPPWSRTDLVPVADRMITPALVDCVGRATSEVDLLMYAIAWNEAYPDSEVDRVLGALEDAKGRDVDVRVTLDASDWIVDNQINDAAVLRLQAAGIPIWFAPSQITTHAKVLRCDDTVIVSDANWSYSGLELMHGTSLVVREPGVVDDYRAWMGAIRETATAL